MTFVVDSSLALAWCFRDEATPRTEELRDRAANHGSVVAHIWPLEVTNVLLHSQRRGRITSRELNDLLRLLEAHDVDVDVEGVSAVFSTVIDMAADQGLTTYDASYVELALRRSLPLATNDEAMRAAAGRLGVELL